MRGLRAVVARGIHISLILAMAPGCVAQNLDEGGRVSGSLRYLALGDSLTIGEGVEVAERWPVQLAGLLRARGLDVADPEFIATTGWTTDQLWAGIDAVDPHGPYAMVSLLIGVNNQYRGLPAEAYREGFRALLRRAIGFAGGEAGHVIVLSIPDWGVTAFAEGRDRAQVACEIDLFNDINREESRAAGVHWVDVTPTSRRMPEAVADDHLHPSGAQYTEWAALALPEALKALGR